MKKISILLLCILSVSIHAQNEGRWRVGLAYSYQNLNMKLSSNQTHSFAKGVDLGIYEISDDKIEQINDRNTITKKGHFYGVTVAYLFINKNAWSIAGNLFSGFNTKNFTVEDQYLGKQYEIKESDPNLWAAFRLDISRKINDKWSVLLHPSYTYSWGEDETIFNATLLDQGTMLISESNQANFHSVHLPVLVQYSIGSFRFHAGPEFYQVMLYNQATLIRNDVVNDSEYKDITDYYFQSENFVAANLAVKWDFLPRFTCTVEGLIGGDTQIHSSIIYHFNAKTTDHEN